MHRKIEENGSCGKRHSQFHQMRLLTSLYGVRPNTQISTFTEHEHTFVFLKEPSISSILSLSDLVYVH